MALLIRFQVSTAAQLHDFRVARHPSESGEWLVARVLARVLQHEEGLTFSPGVCRGEQPALFTPGDGGRLKSWIDIGCPSVKKLRAGLTSAERLVVYTYGRSDQLLHHLAQCHQPQRIAVWRLDRRLLQGLASLIIAPTTYWPLCQEGDELEVAGLRGTCTLLPFP